MKGGIEKSDTKSLPSCNSISDKICVVGTKERIHSATRNIQKVPGQLDNSRTDGRQQKAVKKLNYMSDLCIRMRNRRWCIRRVDGDPKDLE